MGPSNKLAFMQVTWYDQFFDTFVNFAEQRNFMAAPFA